MKELKEFTVILSKGSSVISRRILAENAKEIMNFFEKQNRNNGYWLNFIFEGFPKHEGEKFLNENVAWLKPITLEEFSLN